MVIQLVVIYISILSFVNICFDDKNLIICISLYRIDIDLKLNVNYMYSFIGGLFKLKD